MSIGTEWRDMLGFEVVEISSDVDGVREHRYILRGARSKLINYAPLFGEAKDFCSVLGTARGRLDLANASQSPIAQHLFKRLRLHSKVLGESLLRIRFVAKCRRRVALHFMHVALLSGRFVHFVVHSSLLCRCRPASYSCVYQPGDRPGVSPTWPIG